MNDNFMSNDHDEDFARKLTQVAEQTHASGQFDAELEEKLRSTYRSRVGWWMAFNQVSPTLRWVGLMILLALVLSWSIRSLIPAPQPAVENTPATPGLSTAVPDDSQNLTPAPEGEGIEFRGAKLFMNAPMPDSPGQANVYTAIESQPATAEYAQSLARQFGIAGEVYLTQAQIPGTAAFMVTDGKQQLIVYGENNYSYTSDMVANSRSYNGFESKNAEATIREFLQSHGFAIDVRLIESGSFGGYALQQLSPDGYPIEYDSYSQPAVRITLKEDGSVLGMTVLLASYDPNPIGSFGIISADEALQLLLDDNISAGKLESSHGGAAETAAPPQIWYHDQPNDQTVTIYGNVSASRAVDASKPAVVFIDSVQVTGNISGMDAVEYYTFVQATGHYFVENGVRKFNVDAWDADATAAYVFGWARREADRIIMVNEDGSGSEYALLDPPADLPIDIPFPDSQLVANGALVNGELYWTMLSYYPDGGMGGGGGGGGGMGLYPLNLSGVPIPFPTATAMQGSQYTAAELASFVRYAVQEGDTLASIASKYNVAVSELSRANNLSDENVIGVGWTLIIPGVAGPSRLDGAEGVIQVQLFEKPDGRQRDAYTFLGKEDQAYYQVQGENLEHLQEVANRPIKIWGAITYDEMGTAFLTFERFESLYPDLQFEMLTGTQQNTEIDGTSVVLFTSGGTTYIQMQPSGGAPDYSTYEGVSEVNVEVLRIPGESYAGYPVVRVFNSGPTINPANGEPLRLPSVTDKLEVRYPDPYGNADAYVYPDVIIERIELMYLTNNPAYRDSDNPDAPVDPGYLQPIWHFQGYYSNGDMLDILVQALKQEYLSPDINP